MGPFVAASAVAETLQKQTLAVAVAVVEVEVVVAVVEIFSRFLRICS